MLGGIDPVIIFQFSALAPTVGEVISKIPLSSKVPSLILQPPVPIYLDERTFNIVIGNTSKSVDIETSTETKTDGTAPDVSQKAIQSSVEINIRGKTNSVPITLLSAMIDKVYEKVTSKEYSVSFFYGATTIFNAYLQKYSVEAVDNTDMLEIKISLSKGDKNPVKAPGVPSVPGSTGTIPVGVS